MKYILIILLVISGYVVHAQTPRPTGNPTQFSTGWFRQGYQQSDSATIVAKRDTSWTPRFPGTIILWQNAGVDSLYWFHNGSKWKQVGSGGITSVTWGSITGTLSNQTDLQNALNLKLNISDTAAMLLPYLRKIDTTAMLLPYLRKADTTAMLANYFNVRGYGIVGSGKTIAADTSSVNSLVTQYDLANNVYVVGRNLRIISGSPNKDTLATIDTLITATVALADSSTKAASTAWVKQQAYGTGSGSSTAPGSTGDMPYKGSNGTFSTSPGSFFNIDSANKKINIGNPSSTVATINIDSGGINVFKEKYYINGESVIEQNSTGNQTEFTTAAANIQTRIFTGGTARFTVTNTLTNIATASTTIANDLQLGGVGFGRWTGTDLRVGSVDAGFNTVGMYVAGSRKGEWTSGGTLKINSTSTADGISKRRLFVNGSVGINKDSVPIITSMTSQYVLVQDTASGADSGQVKRILPANLGASNIYNADGTLSANRTVTGGTKNLTFTGVGDYNIYATHFSFAKTDGSAIYTGMVGSNAANQWQLGYFKSGVIGPAIRIDTNNNVIAGATYNTTYPLYATGSAMFAGDGLVSFAGNFYHVSDITTNTTIGLREYFMTVDCTSGNVVITLPTAASAFGAATGIVYVFKRLDASGNTITVQVSGGSGDLIDGAGSFTIVGQYTVKEIICSSASGWSVK